MPVDPESPALYSFLYGDALYGTYLPPVAIVTDPVVKGTAVFDGDALFFESGDGGNVDFQQGEPRRSGGLCNAVYLSLFGGNHDDTGLPGDLKTWWGNVLHSDTDFQLRGQFERTLNDTALTSGNIPVIEAAGDADLEWMVTLGVADEVSVEVSIVGPKRIEVTTNITVEGEAFTFIFFTNWQSKS